MVLNLSKDIEKGLTADKKHIPSKYFYDAKGDKIFIEIMNMPEYYLTRAEFEIFDLKAPEIVEAFNIDKNKSFDLIELGSGDGTKTKKILSELIAQNYNFNYVSIDISQDSLDNLKVNLAETFPTLNIVTKQGDYLGVLDDLKEKKSKKVILFLGSNLGNFEDISAKQFLTKLNDSLNLDDKLLIGLDLIKSKDIVLPAYDDKYGITARFNLNLLERINREMNANFNINNFYHKAEYDEADGIARSFIISKKVQHVDIKSIARRIYFEKDERIYTELSRKYNDKILNELLSNLELKIVNKFTDSNNFFADYIFNKSNDD